MINFGSKQKKIKENTKGLRLKKGIFFLEMKVERLLAMLVV